MRYASAAGTERVVSIVGQDEVDLDRNYISWVSPLARHLEILEVRYERIEVKPFREPPGAEAAPRP